ncbi:hypothetical protein Tco_0214351 [Tanacetum coccineum]
MPKSIHLDHRDTAHYIPMYHRIGGFTGHEREVYKSLVLCLIYEGRVIDSTFLDDQPNLRPTFAAIGSDCLLNIDEKIYPIFVLQFYKSVRIIRNLNGTISIAFIINNSEITLSLVEFARILKIPCQEVCIVKRCKRHCEASPPIQGALVSSGFELSRSGVGQAKVEESKEKTKKRSINIELCMYEEFSTIASLVKYIREDKVINVVVQRLEKKAQDEKRERKEQKKLKRTNIGSIVVPDTPPSFWP